MTTTIVTILGARPQFIKAAVVSRALAKYSSLQEILVHTGQHYDDNMSDIFFRELDLKRPDYNLQVGSDSHGAQTAKMLDGIEKILIKYKPALVLVYGDTNSTLAGALAAAKLHIPVAHVEAGLRSFNKKMPEEVNRVLTDHIADFLFCPTETAIKNALQEGIERNKIYMTGDVMYDAAIYYEKLAAIKNSILEKLNLQPKKYLLATIHRAENTDDLSLLTRLFSNLIKVAKKYPLVLPLHPRTQAVLSQYSLWEEAQQVIKIIEPVGLLDMITLEKNAQLIITDSGGVQKEAFFVKVPCITVRPQTEWVELIETGWNFLLPPHLSDQLLEVVERRCNTKGEEVKLYGDGSASERIAKICIDYIENKKEFELSIAASDKTSKKNTLEMEMLG